MPGSKGWLFGHFSAALHPPRDMMSARPSPARSPAWLRRFSARSRLRGLQLAVLVGMMLLACGEARAVNLTWNGGGKKNNWSDKNNWGGTAINGADTLIFAGTTQLTNVNDIDPTTASGTNVSITFNNTAGAFTISGSAMSFTGASVLTNQDTNTQTISLDGFILAGTGTQTIAATSGELLINSVISGTTPLNFTGLRTTLTGANTYTGLTTITSGAVNIQDASALGGTTNGTVVRAGGALELQGGITVAGEALTLSGSGVSNGGALRNVSGTNTYAGIITLGTNSRINSDSGLLTLNTGTITGSGFGLIVGGSGNTTISSVIGTGTGSLTKDGSGTLTLSAANTYTGTTGITGGTVVLGANDVFGSGSLTISSATLSISSFNDTVGAVTVTSGTILGTTGVLTGSSYTFNGTSAATAILGGTGSLTKSGTGTLTLSATNTYSGLTTVSGGTLALGANNAVGTGGLTVNGGAFDMAAYNDTVGAVTVTSGTILGTSGVLTGSSYTFDGNGAATAILGGSGGLTKSGTGTASTLSGANTYTGTTTIASGTLSAGSIVVSAGASNLGNASSAVVLGDGTNQGTLSYTGSTSTYTRGFTVNAGGGQLITSTAGQTLTVATGSITSSSGTFTVGGAGNTVISSTLSLGTGGLTKQDTGILTLQAANTFSGLTTVSGGTLAYGANDALGSGGLTVNGGNLDISSFSDTVGAVIVTSSTIFGTTGVLSGSSYAFNGDGDAVAILGGAGTLTKSGVGTTSILSGANTYSGATSISSGVLNIQNNLALGGTAAGTTVAAGAALQMQGGITVTGEALTLSGSGVSNDGALRNISGNSTYAGVVTLGTNSRINSDAGILTLNTGTITGSGFGLSVGGSGSTTISSIIATGAGSFTKDGSGTVTLSGANTYTGATTVSAGVLNVQNGTGLGTTAGGVTVTSGAALELQGGITVGAESLSLAGTGISSGGALRNVSGTNTYQGGITQTAASRINADADQLTLSGAIGGAFGLTFGGVGNIVVSNTIAIGNNTLTKDGTGTLTLSAANTYTGATTVSAGVLNVQNATGLGTTAGGVTVSSGAALALQGGITIGAEALSLSGSGVNNGGALRNVSGDNTYGGVITLAAATEIASDSGTLTISSAGNITGNFGLTFDGAGNIVLADNFNPGTKTQTLTKNGSGKLTLSAANGYTGLTTVAGGTLAYGITNAISTGGITVQNGATLDLGAFSDSVGAVTLTSGNIIGSGALTSTAGFTTTSGTVSAVLDGAVGLAQVGGGTTVLSGANTFSGATTIASGGVLNVQNAAGLGTTAGGVTVSSGGALELQGGITIGAEALSLSGSGVSNAGALRNVSGSNTYGGLITLGTSSRINSDSGLLTISNAGTITGAGFGLTVGGAGDTTIASIIGTTTGGLTKDGVGKLTLSATSSYTGATTINGGILSTGTLANGGVGSGIGTSGTAAANLVIDGGTLQYTGTTVSINRMFTTGTGGATLDASGSGALTLSNTSAVALAGTNTARTLTLTGTSLGANTLAAQITDNGTGATSLLKDGTGTWVLGGTANSYTGSTTIRNGTLQLSSTSANSLSTATTITLGGTASQGKLVLGSGAGAASQTIAGLSTTGNGGSVVGGASTASTLTVNVATGSSSTFGGVLGGAGTNENNLALTKTGGGLLTLTGSSTYTGVTTLSGGTVSISSAANLGSSSAGITFATTASTLNVSNDVTLSKAITQNTAATYDVDAGKTLTLSGTINGASQLLKTGAGTVVLNAANAYSGKTNVLGGTLKLGVDNAIAGPNIDIIGGTLDLNGRNEAFSTVSPTFTLGNSVTAGTVIGTGTLTVQSGGGGYAVRYGSVGESSVLSGSAGLTKTTAQTVTLSGNNAYTGTTSVQNGILQFATTASGSVAQALGTNSTVNLGVAGTSSGILQYTGAAGTLSKNIFALGNGSDTIQNAGTGVLTLSGSLVKDGTVLTLKGGSNGINVTGVISGTAANSDLYVSNGLTTLSATSSYNGPTFIVDSGTLALGINNAVPSGSVVTIGGAGGPGTFTMGGYSNAIGGLVFSGSGGTLAMNANQTSSAQLTSSGAVTLGANSSLNLAGTSATSGLFRLITASSVSGSFNSFSGLSGYTLQYTGTSINAQQQAVMGTISATTAAASIITGGSTAITYSLTNNNLAGGATLTYSSANGTNVSGSSSGTLAAGATASNVGGLFFTSSTFGSGQTGTFTVSDPNAVGSPQAGSVTVDVYAHAQNTLSTGTIGLGNVRIGYATPVTGTIGAGNAAGYRVDMSGTASPSSSGNVSLSSLSGTSAVTAGATGTITATLGTGNTAGGINQNFTYTFGDASSLSGASTNVGTAAITVTGGVYDYANAKYTGGTLAFGNVRTNATVSNQTVAIGNQTVTNAAYQDLLNVSGSATNAAVTATGFTGLAASTGGATTNNLSVGVSTATAGSLAGTVNLTLVSNANGVAGLSNGTATVVGTPGAITTTGGVYDYANAKYTGNTLAFGNVHQGASVASKDVTFGNQTVTNASYQDTLNVSATTGNSLVGATGFTGLAASTNGLTTGNLTVSVNTATAGSLASTLSLSLVSNANGVAGLSNGTATVVGTPGAITTTGMVYSGQATWATNGGGNWGTLSGTGASSFGSNWGAYQGSPGLDPGYTNTDTATFGSALLSGTAAINSAGANISLKAITFDNASASYSIYQTGGSDAISLVGSGTDSSLITVLSGAHAIHSDITLGSSLTVDVASSSSLTFHDTLSGLAGYSLTKTGAGTLYFVGNQDYAGNTEITQGMVSLLSGTAPLGFGTVTVYGGATLDLNHLALSNTLNVLSGGTLLNTGTTTAVVVDPGTTVDFGGTTSGSVDVEANGTANFTGTIAPASTISIASGGTATMSADIAGSVDVSGNATVGTSGVLTGDLTVNSGGVVTFDGSNTTGSSFNVASGGTVNTGTSSILDGQLHVAGTATVAGTLTTNADLKVEQGGTVTLTSAAVLNQAAMHNDGSLIVNRSTGQNWTVAMTGTGAIQKQGAGTLTLGGGDALSAIDVQQGTVIVTGSFNDAAVWLATNTALGGAGMVGSIGGSGSVNPGNSPGIMTVTSVDPTSGVSFNFEFTAASTYPDWSNATNSINDVLHLTSGTPFTSDLTDANVVNVYLDAPLEYGGTFYGGFFAAIDILNSVKNATFNYFGPSSLPGVDQVTYNGKTYQRLNSSLVTVTTTQVGSANFADGTVTNGFTTSFIVVPEPSTAVLALCGMGLVAALWRRRR